jgi:sec-independent protein translocase protein TatA
MIPGLPQVGGMELLILLVIILLFFGASRVPELARSLGKGKREFQKGVEEAKAEEEREKADAPQDKEEWTAPEEAHREDGSVRAREQPKTGSNSRAQRLGTFQRGG